MSTRSKEPARGLTGLVRPLAPLACLAALTIVASAGVAVVSPGSAPAGQPPAAPASAIVVAGQPFDVGRPVVLWKDPQGFDAYQLRCIDQHGGCCDGDSKRYGARKGLTSESVDELQDVVSQLVLHFDGCVNSRSCFKSMHNRPRPSGVGCGLSAHFMIDADGTIYQTLDLVERAFHAEEANATSIGVEICNRGRVDRGEWPKLPAEYRTRPTRDVVINGEHHEAYDFRPEQYDSLVALTRTLLRIFPKIRPVIPEHDGQPIMDTLDDPMSFAGIMGHLHVDLQKQKWDPGALDWHRLMRALNGFELPVQIRSFTDMPRTQPDLVSARRAAFFNAEERATGFFPIASARLWHSGVHIRATLGAAVHAPTRGRIIAARIATARETSGESSRSFVLMRHDLDVDGEPITFFSLIAHLALPDVGSADANAIPWLQSVAHGPVPTRAALDAGQVVTVDERVEAGDVIGHVGTVSRGPEQGPEIHFEIFTTERLGGELGRAFHYVNAAGDGPITRRADLISMADRNGDQEVNADELRQFFRDGDLDRRQALRRVAIRHRHEWGDRTTEAEFVALRELAGVPEPDRRRLYQVAVAPYVFWTDELSRITGLPANQTIYSYNALTFLLELASRAAHVELPRARSRAVGDSGIEPRKLASVPVTDWTEPKASPVEEALFGPPIGVRLGPRRRDDIPLIELAPTDSR
jgi:N-acetylmuramoyl-L-alanine amidase